MDWQTVRLGAALAVAAASAGCGKPAFPQELFTIKAEPEADYPFMLSQTTAKSVGRPIRAASGNRAAVRRTTHSLGSSSVTVTRRWSAESELPASAKLDAQVRHRDKWVQFDGAVYFAEDYNSYGSSSSSERTLTIEGSARNLESKAQERSVQVARSGVALGNPRPSLGVPAGVGR